MAGAPPASSAVRPAGGREGGRTSLIEPRGLVSSSAVGCRARQIDIIVRRRLSRFEYAQPWSSAHPYRSQLTRPQRNQSPSRHVLNADDGWPNIASHVAKSNLSGTLSDVCVPLLLGVVRINYEARTCKKCAAPRNVTHGHRQSIFHRHIPWVTSTERS